MNKKTTAAIICAVCGVIVAVCAFTIVILHKNNSATVNPTVTETSGEIAYSYPDTIEDQEMTEQVEEQITEEQITSVFADNILNLCDQAFGNHDECLYQAYVILRDMGYDYFVPFTSI